MRVAFFATCLTDLFHPDAALDAVRLLSSLGVEVDVPTGLSCCGQPAWNAGHRELARKVARHAAGILEAYEHVVLPSGSCAAMMRHGYPQLLGAEGGGGRVWELSGFLVRVLGVERLGSGLAGLTVAYHHGCHALRELGLRDDARSLLRASGAELVEWPADADCCGFGGLFAVRLPEVSVAMADHKLDNLPPADVLTSTDAGCLLQLGGRLARRGEGATRVAPLASLLWRAREGRA